MRTDKIRKYLIPNIPYLFILWAFLKLGTAYRLAAGNDFAHKLIGLGQTIGPAFVDFAPGLVPLDWLVGIVGAVGFRLLIYFKSKNAKKFRRDAEYGSARWGTGKDIKPFVDPRFENNVILTGTEFLTMNTRPKIPANARNLNCCIIGSSGSGKTRFWLTPQLLQAHSSYVVVDPKGGVLGQVGGFLQKRGYKIKVFNSIDGISAMQHFSVTDINPAMAHARRVIGAFEEHQITGFGRAGRRTDVIEPLGAQPAHIPAGVIDDPRNVPRAIKGSSRRTDNIFSCACVALCRAGVFCFPDFETKCPEVRCRSPPLLHFVSAQPRTN